MSAPTLADCYVPVPLRWRHVTAGDTIVTPDGALWHIGQRTPAGDVYAVRGEDEHTGTPDPDALVTVLVPATEREALTAARDELAAQVTERRTA